jgi:uncharacterized protein (TIGR02453 family)
MELTLKYLKTLSRNNNRDWFEKNKSKYLAAKDEFEILVADVLKDLVEFDSSLTGLNPKKLIFRIYRDVRFSKNKDPYKNNFGASFSANGKGMGTPGYYLHIEPGNNSFIAAGLFQPEPEKLIKVRQEIDYNGRKLRKLFTDRKFKNLFTDFWDEDKLKRAPKGYADDHEFISWLKLKSFIVIANLDDSEIMDRNLKRKLVGYYKMTIPLNNFLKEALD